MSRLGTSGSLSAAQHGNRVGERSLRYWFSPSGRPKVFLSMNSKHGGGGPVCRPSNIIGCMSCLLTR